MEQLLSLRNKQIISVTDIDEVKEFDENAISLKSGENVIEIKGKNLKVTGFDGEKKTFSGTGDIESIAFKDGKSAIKKFFK